MIDHLSLLVKDYLRAKAFYAAALQPLGYTLVAELTGAQTPNPAVGRSCCFSEGETPELWLNEVADVTPSHLAFGVNERALVDAFHAAALAAGALDNGAPGERPPPFPPGYYAAFVIDPEGYNLEVVCRKV